MKILVIDMYGYYVLSSIMYWEGHTITSVLFLTKMHTVNLVIENIRPKLRATLQINWRISLKECPSYERWIAEVYQIKGTET